MSLEDLSIEEMQSKLVQAECERDAKGPKHPDYKMACIMVNSIRNAIKEKSQKT